MTGEVRITNDAAADSADVVVRAGQIRFQQPQRPVQG
jgi:hypothetical protein